MKEHFPKKKQWYFVIFLLTTKLFLLTVIVANFIAFEFRYKYN